MSGFPVTFWAALALLGTGLFGTTLTLAVVPVTEASRLGVRGARRRAATTEGLFATLEPVVVRLGAWVSALPLARMRADVDRKLIQSGYWLGATADEVIGMSIALGLAGLLAGGVAASALHLPWWVGLAGAVTGAMHPFAQIREATRVRLRHVERYLPELVDLLTLCMGAGMDFAGALTRVAMDGVRTGTPVYEEIQQMLAELELGRTRARVLEGFAERAPIRPVKDLVAAVVQADEKGTPLADILTIQARMLRMRRSVLAEEAASRAALQLMIPLLLIFLAIMLLIIGPIGITVMEGM